MTPAERARIARAAAERWRRRSGALVGWCIRAGRAGQVERAAHYSVLERVAQTYARELEQLAGEPEKLVPESTLFPLTG